MGEKEVTGNTREETQEQCSKRRYARNNYITNTFFLVNYIHLCHNIFTVHDSVYNPKCILHPQLSYMWWAENLGFVKIRSAKHQGICILDV